MTKRGIRSIIMVMKEKYLQDECETLLSYRHIPFIHLTTFTTRRCPHCGGLINVSIKGNKGLPDLILFKDGKAYFVELKTPKGRLSEEQKEFQKTIAKQGFRFLVIRDIQTFNKFLETI